MCTTSSWMHVWGPTYHAMSPFLYGMGGVIYGKHHHHILWYQAYWMSSDRWSLVYDYVRQEASNKSCAIHNKSKIKRLLSDFETISRCSMLLRSYLGASDRYRVDIQPTRFKVSLYQQNIREFSKYLSRSWEIRPHTWCTFPKSVPKKGVGR